MSNAKSAQENILLNDPYTRAAKELACAAAARLSGAIGEETALDLVSAGELARSMFNEHTDKRPSEAFKAAIAQALAGGATETSTASTRQVGGTHYTDMAIQPMEFARANNLNYHQATVVKYICRYPFKNGIEDLQKAKHTIELCIEYESRGSEDDE